MGYRVCRSKNSAAQQHSTTGSSQPKRTIAKIPPRLANVDHDKRLCGSNETKVNYAKAEERKARLPHERIQSREGKGYRVCRSKNSAAQQHSTTGSSQPKRTIAKIPPPLANVDHDKRLCGSNETKVNYAKAEERKARLPHERIQSPAAATTTTTDTTSERPRHDDLCTHTRGGNVSRKSVTWSLAYQREASNSKYI
jgi:hypothetical protein